MRKAHVSVIWAIALCAVFTAGALAEGLGYATTWSKAGDLEGFENPTGQPSQVPEGGHPGGFLKVTRIGGVNITVKPVPYLRKSWAELFGDEPGTIAFEVKVLSEHQVPMIVVWLSDGGSAFRYGLVTQNKLKHPQVRADGWVHYALPWQATWDTARAKEVGWKPNRDTASWQNVMRNPIYSHVDFLGADEAKGDQSVGIDNFVVHTGKVMDPKMAAVIRETAMAPLPPQEGPVAFYSFEEGLGTTLKDHSDFGNHGTIHGATWVPVGKGYALEFDGVDDYVNCGDSHSLNAREQVTLEAWVYATERLKDYDVEARILGKGPSFALTRYRDETWAYIMGGQIGHRVNAFLAYDKWVHLALAYDGTVSRCYIDGVFVGAAKPSTQMLPGSNFCLASETGDKRFRGRIAGVKLYNRALSQEEIWEDIRTSWVTGSVIPSPVAVGAFGQIKVELDAARLGCPLKGVEIVVDVVSAAPSKTAPNVAAKVRELNHLGRAVATLDAAALESGEYLVRAVAKDTQGNTIGVPGTAHVSWPGANSFPRGPEGARQLNNFVTELLHVAGPDASGAGGSFVNPRTGWIFISNLAADKVTLISEADGKETEYPLAQDFNEAYETMRFLPEGKYAIKTPEARELIVRAIGQSIHSAANYNPEVKGLGTHAGAFENRYVFPHMNSLETYLGYLDEPFVKKWRAKGRMILPHLSYGIKPKEGQSKVDAAYEKLINHPGFTHPDASGVNCDEFGWPSEFSAIWAEAIERAVADPKYQGRIFNAFSYRPFSHFDDERGRKLVAAVRKTHGAYLWEAYVKDQRTELDAWRHLNQVFAENATVYSKKYPGIMKDVVVCSYIMLSAPNESTMTLPQVNLKTFMDMQFNMAANHPGFEGCRGMLTYRSNYAEPETLRWAARLFRHYCIEGRTELFSKDPYLPPHLDNPTFEHEGRGWTLSPAGEGGIRFDVVPGISYLAYSYPPTAEGDTALITTRAENAPNVFSQEIKNLEPGRLYALRMTIVDVDDFFGSRSRQAKHAVSIAIENTEAVPEESIETLYPSCYAHRYQNFDKAKPLWFSYYVLVFRAKGQTATLRVSDWNSPEEPDGPVGQRLAYLLTGVRPYFLE